MMKQAVLMSAVVVVENVDAYKPMEGRSYGKGGKRNNKANELLANQRQQKAKQEAANVTFGGKKGIAEGTKDGSSDFNRKHILRRRAWPKSVGSALKTPRFGDGDANPSPKNNVGHEGTQGSEEKRMYVLNGGPWGGEIWR